MTWQARRRRTSACICILLFTALCIRLYSCLRTEKPEAVETVTAPTVQNSESSQTSILPETTEPPAAPSWNPRLEPLSGGMYIGQVPHIPQAGRYPSGCESVSAVALLQYYGIEITVDEFIGQHLPREGYPACAEDGKMYGESPWEAFIGDPYSSSGYGCYSPAIVRALKEIVPSEYSVHSVTNASLSLLCAEYIDKGHPVLVWATMYMKEPYNGNAWILPDGTHFQFICPEHALLLIGYDEECYYFSDPLSDEAVTAYPKAACETAYTALYQQAVVLLPAAQ